MLTETHKAALRDVIRLYSLDYGFDIRETGDVLHEYQKAVDALESGKDFAQGLLDRINGFYANVPRLANPCEPHPDKRLYQRLCAFFEANYGNVMIEFDSD